MKVSTKLALAFSVLVILGLVQGAFSWLTLHGLTADMASLIDDRMAKVDQLSEIKDNANVGARAVRNMVLLTEASEKRSEHKRIETGNARSAELVHALEASSHSEHGKALLQAVIDSHGPYRAAIDKAIELALADKGAESTEFLLKTVRPVQSTYFKALDAAIDFQQEEATRLGKEARTKVATATAMLVFIALGAAAIGALTAWTISRSLTRQLGGEPAEVVRVANAIAAGDLTAPIAVRAGDEASIAAAMNQMSRNLSHIVGRVRQSSDSIATGSSQIATGNADLSQRTEEQAANLEQTAASMEELTSTVQNNAETARQAAQLAVSATAVATQGGAVVSEVVSTMEAITASSQKIADIIGVIDGIAFQTNILALNASGRSGSRRRAGSRICGGCW